MQIQANTAAPTLPALLPPLRKEVRIEAGGMDFNHSPTWVIQDLLNNNFFHIGWKEFEILSRWRAIAPEQLLKELAQNSLAEVTPDDLMRLLVFLSNYALIEQPFEAMKRSKEKTVPPKAGFFKWLVDHYLFFRVPLVQPDQFLTRTYPYIAWAFSFTFVVCVLIFTVLGLMVLASSWTEYESTFFDLFNWESLVLYGVSLCIVKVFHELGHAYACKKQGVRVPSMGVAFLVMMPLLYTDTTESWRVKDPMKRIQIALAGVWMEFCIAVLALWLWMIVSPGVVRSILFFMSSVSLATTLLINISPFLRFDGYHVLSDLLSMRNLQTRSFALTRWMIREWIFGLADPVPEQFTRAKRITLYIYAVAAWAYRFFLFLGIALLVYHFFFKMLGIILFGIEMFYFILGPIYREIKVWWSIRDRIHSNAHTKRSLWILGFLSILIIFPWAHTVSLPATVAPYEQKYFLKEPARIKAIYIKQGDKVEEGQLLMTLESPDLEYSILLASYEVTRAEWLLRDAMTRKDQLSKQGVTLSQLENAEAALHEKQDIQKTFTVVAPFEGVVAELAEGIKPGVWVQAKQALFVLTNPNHWVIKSYATAPQMGSLAVDQPGRFFPDNLAHDSVDVKISHMNEQATTVLANFDPDRRLSVYLKDSAPESAYHASTLGGKIATRRTEQNDHVPEESIYQITLAPSDDSEIQMNTVERGVVKVRVPRFFWIGAWIKKWAVTSYQEANF